MSKVKALSLIVTLSVLLCSCEDGGRTIQGLFNAQPLGWSLDTGASGAVFEVAGELESAADRLFANPFPVFKSLTASNKADMQSCDTDDTAVVTIYSTNGMAQNEIDVTLDGSEIGSLKTYFPSDEPSCRTPTADGVITLLVPAGDHTLEAASGNLTWPSHSFSVDKCVCIVLPLS